MKKIILCLFVLCNLVVQAQWKQSLTGQTSLVRDVSVVSNDIIWAKDQIGTSVSISLDGGNYWVTKNLPTEMINGGIGGFSAVSATTAYIIVCENAQKGVYKTTNSGDSWVKKTTAFNADSPFPDFVYFWNENDGVAVGDGYATTNQSLEIYTTNNGGTQWNRVTASNIPSTIYDWAYNGNTSFKVHGNTIYFETGLGKIFKSVNKGLSWTVINTPIATNQNFSFDFKDDLHGLISYYNASTLSYNLYSTSDGGVNWTSINPTNCYSELYYNQLNGVYYSTHSNYGLSYSKDNGNTWTLHPSFKNVGVSALEISSTGKMFMGGWRYMYQTENYEGVNIWVKEAKITGVNTMDITYSEIPDPVSSKDITNYAIGYIENKILKSLNIQSLTQDATNQSIVHVTMQSDLPLDTIKVNIGGVMDNTGINGYSVINRSLTLYNFNPSKTLQVNTAGTLASLLTANELATVTNLTLTGTIDARDFVTLRDAMPLLSSLDISGVIIAAYDGTAGPVNVKVSSTSAINEPEKVELDDDPLHSLSAQHIKMQTKTTTSTTYPANEIPQFAFCNPNTWVGKVSLKSIVLPNSTTSIGSDAFDSCTGLTSITIPASVTSIGDYALYFCKGLTSITIPSSVSSIGDYALYYCAGLTSITIPVSVISIGDQAFYKCGLINVDNGNPNYSSQEGVLYNKLKTQIIQCPTVKTGSFSILNSVISIGISAFESCTGLTSITLPSSVSSIGNFAFYYCSGLSSITIPASVTSIGDQAFYKCGLINVDNGNPNYSSQEGVLYNKLKTQIIQCPTVKTGSFSIPNSVTLIGDYAFFYCNGLTSITIPVSVSSIGERTFYRCTGLTSITIPASVTTIGSYAFSYCTGFTSIYANPVTPVDLNNQYSVFYNINTTTCTLYVPQGSKAAYQAAYQWKDFTNIVENITTVSKTLQVNTAGTLASLLTANELATVTNLTLTGTIDARDFVILRDAMPLLSSLDISGVTIAAYDGTAGPANVKVSSTSAINEPEKVELDDDPLHSLSAQHIKMQTKTTTSTTYPANEIPTYAFYNPTTYIGKVSLISLKLPSTSVSIGNYAFRNCSGLTSIEIPSSVTTIGSGAFYVCSMLKSVTIPSSVSTINNYAFSFCKELTSITIPNSVISLGIQAFSNCSRLTSVTIPSSVISIGSLVFVNCSVLTSINVETDNQQYSSLNGVLFDKNLTNLILYPSAKTGSYSIPASVLSIGNQAFYSCSGLTDITIPSSISSIGIQAFTLCSGLTLINVEAANQNYSSLSGVLFDKNKNKLIQYPCAKIGIYTIPSSVKDIELNAFSNCFGLESVIIPTSVQTIGIYAFSNCTNLTSITIPLSIAYIGSGAFSGCSGLTSIYANSSSPINISASGSVFYKINTTTCTLYVPIGSKAAYQAADQWKDFTNIVEYTTAISTVNSESIQIYPNPIIDNFSIDGLEGTSDVRLTDLNGKMLISKQVSMNENVSISNLPKGMYLIQLINNGNIYYKKMIKK